MKQTFNPTNF